MPRPDQPQFARKPRLRVRIRLGDLNLDLGDDDRIFIEHTVRGDAGEFKADDIARHLERFFWKHL